MKLPINILPKRQEEKGAATTFLHVCVGGDLPKIVSPGLENCRGVFLGFIRIRPTSWGQNPSWKRPCAGVQLVDLRSDIRCKHERQPILQHLQYHIRAQRSEGLQPTSFRFLRLLRSLVNTFAIVQERPGVVIDMSTLPQATEVSVWRHALRETSTSSARNQCAVAQGTEGPYQAP